TLHGVQSTNSSRSCEPMAYYARGGPIGQLFESFAGPFQKTKMAAIGLGTGSVGAYAQPGQQWTFFEINPAVVRVAEDPKYFTYLRDCVKNYRIVVGDARIEMGHQPDGEFDLMVFDAFTSDAIPIHLLTREALTLYIRKLAPHGVLAFHISNRYLDLA